VQQLVDNAQQSFPALQYQSLKPSSRLNAEQSNEHAQSIAQAISDAWKSPEIPNGIPLTAQAVYEIAGLVQTLGPDAAAKALIPTEHRNDRLDEQRLQAILNDKWVPENYYRARSAIYNHFNRPTSSKP
jgi:hypothetical protein